MRGVSHIVVVAHLRRVLLLHDHHHPERVMDGAELRAGADSEAEHLLNSAGPFVAPREVALVEDIVPATKTPRAP